MTDSAPEKRSFVRIAVDERVEYRRLLPEEAGHLATSILSRSPGELAAAVAAGREGGLSDYEAGLLRRLEVIEAKLNLVLDLLAERGAPGEANPFREGRLINLSGAGLVFAGPEEPGLKAGDRLEVRVYLPDLTGQPVTSLGRVVRVEAPPRKKDEAGWRTAVGFEVIAEGDRERIISYTFRCQRQFIQQSQAEGK